MTLVHENWWRSTWGRQWRTPLALGIVLISLIITSVIGTVLFVRIFAKANDDQRGLLLWLGVLAIFAGALIIGCGLILWFSLRAQRLKLRWQNADLERSNSELEQFAYVASHDLQEPLRKVASFCQMLQRRYAGKLDDRADQYIEFAVDGAKRMQKLINDLLAFSRVGRTTGEFVPVELDAILERAKNSLAVALEETGATIASDPLPNVYGNPVLLAQVFQNLIGNAIKFRGTEAPVLRITVEQRDNDWLLCCHDNGIGIEPQYAERIFVIFQRLHTKEAYSGTGIGLALARKIVEHHGGRIWLNTDDSSSGAAFCWTLPVAPELVYENGNSSD